jgi:hypothetical protein
MYFVKFKDAFKAGYSISRVTNNFLTGNLNDSKPNVMMSRRDTDYNNFYKNALVTINGHFHITDTDGVNGIYVLDAGKSLSISKQNQIGIHSFKSIGNIKVVRFDKSDMVTNDDCTIKFKINESLENKTVIISLCGYLTFQENMKFYPTGDNVFKIDFNNLNMLDRFYELLKYIDLSSLPISFGINNCTQISKDQLLTDENIIALLGLSQSFIVIVDSPKLDISRRYVKRVGVPGCYSSYTKPELPLVCGLGRYVEYWSVEEDGVHNLSVYDNVVERYLYDTNINMPSVDNRYDPRYSQRVSDAYFVRISK